MQWSLECFMQSNNFAKSVRDEPICSTVKTTQIHRDGHEHAQCAKCELCQLKRIESVVLVKTKKNWLAKKSWQARWLCLHFIYK